MGCLKYFGHNALWKNDSWVAISARNRLSIAYFGFNLYLFSGDRKLLLTFIYFYEIQKIR